MVSLAERSVLDATRAPRPRGASAGPEETGDRLLAAARGVGDQLAQLAVRGAGDATWNGVRLDDRRRKVSGPLGLDLYGGLPGVTLFLAQLGHLPGGDRFTALAEEALATQLAQIDRGAPLGPRIGAFSGRAGMIYLFGRLSSLWGRDEMRQRAEALVADLPPLIEKDVELDVIGGAAGCLGVLLALDRIAPAARTREVARLCGERLLATARETEAGLAWPMPSAPDRMGTGFAHGTAGAAWALLGLWARTADPRYRRAAEGALAHERRFFRPSGSTNWCHGAPGIGLARLARLTLMDDAIVRAEIDTALRTTIACATGVDHSLCHGDLGNLELVIEARRTLRDPRLEAPLARAATAILAAVRHDGPHRGWALSVESPGLMLGLAGIGLGLLRLATRGRIPSVLLLDD